MYIWDEGNRKISSTFDAHTATYSSSYECALVLWVGCGTARRRYVVYDSLWNMDGYGRLVHTAIIIIIVITTAIEQFIHLTLESPPLL